MNIIKYFIAALAFVSMAAHSADSILLMHGAGKGSNQHKDLQYFGKSWSEKSMDLEYYTPGECADVVRIWNKKDARGRIMHYSSSFARLEKMTGKPCTADLSGARWVMSDVQAMWMCSLPNAKSLQTKNIRVAHYSNQAGTAVIEDINQLNNLSWKPVPIKSTTDGLVGLTNGDLDYFFIAQSGIGERIKNGQLVCHASTVRGDRFPYIGTMFKTSGDVEPAMTVQHIIVTKNLSERDFSIVKNSLDPATNKDFRARLDFHGYKVDPLKSDSDMLKNFQARVENGLSFYKIK